MAEAHSVPLTAPGDSAMIPSPAGRVFGTAVVGVALTLELAMLVAAARHVITSVEALALHAAVIVGMTFLFLRRLRSGSDGGVALLAVIGTLATGPFGAAGALVLPWLARRSVASEALLSAWYDRIALSTEQDGLTTLSDRVAIGRSANLAAPLPQPFIALFEHGPIAEQQVALGMIARSFHTGYLSALKLALDSPEPVIRVQAAAVAARIRGQLNAEIPALADRAADPTLSSSNAVDVAVQLSAALQSGLLEALEQTTATSVRSGLLARVYARLDARRRNSAAGLAVTSDPRSDRLDDTYAAYLLSHGRFDDFRAWRASARRPLHGRYRRRLVISRIAGATLRGHLVPCTVRRSHPVLR